MGAPRSTPSRVLVLTGGPAAGKTSTARALAETLERCAVVDVDDVRHLVVSGHAAPWDGEEGRRQLDLGVRNACALAGNLIDEGFAVVVADVLTPASEQVYRSLLGDPVVVHLVLSLESARQRESGRERHLSRDEFDVLHALQQTDPPTADRTIDVTLMSPRQQADAVRAVWSGRSPTDEQGDAQPSNG